MSYGLYFLYFNVFVRVLRYTSLLSAANAITALFVCRGRGGGWGALMMRIVIIMGPISTQGG